MEEKQQLRDICCEQCGRFLFRTDKTNGAAGVYAINNGFVYKMPFLFGIVDGGHFFCCKKCWNTWLDERTTEEQRLQAKKDVEDIKKRMEEGKPELLRGLQRIADVYNKFHKK